MNAKTVGRGWLPALLLVSVISLVRTEAMGLEGCLSERCHAQLLSRTTVHAVAEPCEGCHESQTTPHPQKGKTTFRLTQDPPDLCYTCHEPFAGKGRVHSPVEGGMCTTCHNPHASNEPKLLEQPMKSLCGSCHADHVDFKLPHGPVSVGDCAACHASHVSEKRALLVRDGDELCTGCHVDMRELQGKKHVHAPVSAGCTSCHNPHGAAAAKLLAQEGPEVCFSCHGEIGEKVRNAPVPHAALATDKGCASCHSVHASDNEKLLVNPEKDTCAGCHESIVDKNMTVVHEEGKCSGCHDAHGGQHARLLREEFPSDVYVPYTDGAFPLCFTCHKREMVQYAETSFATGFRDGEKNLHYVHVNNPKKGRSCKLCHNVHGTVGPKLVAESVPFGKWNLPLRFVKTETGGGCAPGCHRAASYDRKSPGRKPEPPKATREGR